MRRASRGVSSIAEHVTTHVLNFRNSVGKRKVCFIGRCSILKFLKFLHKQSEGSMIDFARSSINWNRVEGSRSTAWVV